MTTTNVKYAAAAALTVTLASLASSATLLVGRGSTAVDNSTNLYDDAILEGQIKTGATSANTNIEIWCYSESVDSGPTYMGAGGSSGLSGTDAAVTFGDAGQKRLLRLALVIDVVGTSAVVYNFGGISVAQLFGGVMPKKWGVFVTHSTGVALDATAGNHVVEYLGVTYTNA